MPSSQNKTLRMYGPWRGENAQEGRTSFMQFESCFNMDFNGEEAFTRDGRIKIASSGPGPITALADIGTKTIAAVQTATGPALYSVVGPSTFTALTTSGTAPSKYDEWHQIVHWGLSHAIMAGGTGPVMVTDGTTVSPLAAVRGLDSETQGYLTAVPAFKYLAVYRNRLFGMLEQGTVAFSESSSAINVIPVDGTAPQDAANLWPSGNDFDVRASPSDKAAGMMVWGDVLVIFTREGVWLYDDSTLRQIPGAPGCVAPWSLASTPHGLVYLSHDGLRRFTGNASQKISPGADEIILRYGADLSKAKGVHVDQKREYRIFVPLDRASDYLCYCWNYEDNRVSPWGGTPYWMPASAEYQAYDVASCAMLYNGLDDRSLVTGDSSGNLWVEDRGFTDNGKPVWSALVFKRAGHGEDAGVRVWRNARVEAKTTGAPLKAALLPDGEEFTSGKGSASQIAQAYSPTVNFTVPTQTTWGSNTSPVPAYTGSSFGPVAFWHTLPYPFARVSRTAQLVLWCDGHNAAGVPTGGRMRVRGAELSFRPQAGRRAGE